MNINTENLEFDQDIPIESKMSTQLGVGRRIEDVWYNEEYLLKEDREQSDIQVKRYNISLLFRNFPPQSSYRVKCFKRKMSLYVNTSPFFSTLYKNKGLKIMGC